jgi:hypothetical protein
VIAIKDFGARGELRISDAPVSLADIAATVLNGVGFDHGGTDGLDIFSISEDQKRTRSFFFYKRATEASLKAIPQIQEFIIRGFVRHKSSWKIGMEYLFHDAEEQIMSFVDLGVLEASKHTDMGWSSEHPRYKVSWTVAEKATLIGKLPQKDQLRIVSRLLNPHPNQKVEIRLNGRSVAVWNIDEPCGWREYDAQIELTEADKNCISRVEFIIKKSGVVSDASPRLLGICVDWVKFE